MEQNQVAPKFFIKTFGCQMNVADTQRMAALLSDSGYKEGKSAEDSEVVLINGCSVRDKAVHKAVSELGRYAKFKGPRVIGLGGCVGQMEKDRLFDQAPYLDFVFGPDAIDQLPEMVYRARKGHRHFLYTDFDKKEVYNTETRVEPRQSSAFVNIMKGCDKFCTYCIVPFTRGREKSRPIDEVVFDVKRLLASGIREVTLLGQNVNSFGKGNTNTAGREPLELHNIIGKVGPEAGQENFPQLLRELDHLDGLKRVRFTSSHPLDFSDELIECYGKLESLANHLHLPVQSGSNRVLRKMARHHKIEHYILQMDRLRELRPDVGLGTDLIVGFPGETEEDFEATLGLLDRIQFDSVYAFAYSPRPGTRAYKLEDDVSAADKNRRLNTLLDKQRGISARRNAERVGRTYEVLVEGPAKNQNLQKQYPGQRVWTGRTSCNRVVNFVAGRDLSGEFVQTKIQNSTPLSLYGELV